MTGTPWHIEYGDKLKGKRRHKSSCIYYDNGHCIFKVTSCIGSSHCNSYRTHKNDQVDLAAEKALKKQKLLEKRQRKLQQKREQYHVDIIYNGINQELYNIFHSYLYNNSFLLTKIEKNQGLHNSNQLYIQIVDKFCSILDKKYFTNLTIKCLTIQAFNISFDLNEFEKGIKDLYKNS